MAAMGRSILMSRHMLCLFSASRLCLRHAMMYTSGTVMVARGCVTTSSESTTGTSPSAETLRKKFGWMSKHVPCFGVNGDNITVIQEPTQFYQTFKTMMTRAKKRIVIASLYLGTGSLEKDLVACIEEVCERSDNGNKDNFEVHILLDHCRGSRGGDKSSRTELCPLIEKFGHQVKVYLYHTPDLRGWLRQCIPERFNEVVGLNHMKIYLVDDDFIISGANLSDSYFTNRQDRYIQFRSCPAMADYLSDLVKTVARVSFHLQGDNSTVYPVNTPHPYEGSETEYKDYGNEIVCKVIHKDDGANGEPASPAGHPNTTVDNTDNTEDRKVDTWLYPLIQMAPFRIHDDELVTKGLFTQSECGDRILMASGYFNLTDEYMEEILSQSQGNFEILTSSPETNGWFGARGINGYVPTAYTYIARQFFEHVMRSDQQQRIRMFEYYRRDWTYHCKGLWYCLPGSSLPILTVIGSTNFGYRSVFRDLECQVAMVTSNVKLQQQLKEEHQRLFESSSLVTASTFEQQDRYVPLWGRIVTKVIKTFF